MGGSGRSVKWDGIGELNLGGGAPCHPDRSFDTIACADEDPLSVLAALERGVHAALVEPALGARLLDWGDGRAVPEGIAVAKTLSVGEAARLAVCRLRPWLGGCDSGSLRVVVNVSVGPYLCRPLQMGADVVIEDLGGLLDPALLPDGPSGPRVAVVARNGQAWERFWGQVAATGSPVGLGAADEGRLGAGLRCLSGTTQRRSDVALAVAHYLAAHPGVGWVSYPGLPEDEANTDARATLEHGFGPLVAFGLLGEEPWDGETTGDGPGRPCRSRLYRGAQPGSLVFSAGTESALDVVGALDRLIAEGLALGSNGR